jgi:hypothetical protein
MSLKTENSRRVAKSRPVCMDLKGYHIYNVAKTNQKIPIGLIRERVIKIIKFIHTG